MLFSISIDKKEQITPIRSTTLADIGYSEKDLENLVSVNITKLIPENQLMVLFQERPFDEAADIYALDKDGNLYIFEIKRWKSHSENLLQVLRYGQIYGQYSYEQLQTLLSKYTKTPGIDLANKHFQYFHDVLDEPLPHHRFNNDQRFVVITNGVDVNTLNAIKYWHDKGLKIEALPYKVYKINDRHVFEFNTYNPENEVLIEKEEGYFIVNTNVTWMEDAYKDMLDNEKAAAYYNRKYGISNISKGDTVFLYHVGIGVIAYGKAVDVFQKTPIDGDIDGEYNIKLKFDWKVNPDIEQDKAVKAWEINEKLGTGHRFRNTVFSISSEMAEVIKEIANSKNK